ncbi:MAG: AMP-binding protein [Sphaerochaetaceae bacterium]|nr:AMP-binding protein [Sphaerochaetaceae bacterium]
MDQSNNDLDRYRGKFFTGVWPSIPQMFMITLDQFPKRPAFTVISGAEKTTLSYTEVYEKIIGVATFLQERGIKKGDRVALNGKNSPEWAIAYLGIQFASAVVVPLDNQLPSDRVKALTAFSEAKIFFGDSDVLEKLGTQADLITVMLDGPATEDHIAFTDIPATKKKPESLPTESDIAAILFTSGTTGNEKGVILTHGNFVSNVFQAGDPNFLAISHEDVFYALLPLHHSYTMTAVFLESLKHGSELLFGQGIVVSRVLHEMRFGEVTMFLAIPLLYNKLLAGLLKKVREKGIAPYALIRTMMIINGFLRKTLHINRGRKWFHKLLDGIGMASNRICICGGGPLSPKTFQQYQQLGLDFIQGYGLTETAPILTLNPVSRFKIKSVGKVLPLIEMRIADPDLLGVGEVQVKGPNVGLGYYKDKENTAQLFTEDGFLRTGDLGYLDKEHYLYLKGRAKNLIVTEGGKNVYPEEIEDMFQLYNEIDQLLIRGYIANKAAQAEGIEALIYPNHDHYKQLGYDPTQITQDIEKIVHEVNKKLAAYKKIEKITIVAKPMAMTSTKKIQRNKVSRTIDRLRKL